MGVALVANAAACYVGRHTFNCPPLWYSKKQSIYSQLTRKGLYIVAPTIGDLRDQKVACSTSNHQDLHFKYCV